MQLSFEKIEVMCGTKEINQIKECKMLPIFEEKVCKFLSTLSEELMGLKEAKQYPDVFAFAFFCRAANLKKNYMQLGLNLENRLGRGIVFHIAPGNVAVNFAYSLVTALLAGNPSIVKVSSRYFRQREIILEEMNKVANRCEYRWIVPYINVWKYPNEEETITRHISEICQVRLIWGGDKTIERIRQFPLMYKAEDIAFSDRCSMSVIESQKILETSDMSIVVRNFYNDTYLSDQNACTSPFLIVWMGDKKTSFAAQEKFWKELRDYVYSNYTLEPLIAVNKINAGCKAAIELEPLIGIRHENNYVWRMQIDKLVPNLSEYRCVGGFFYEYICEQGYLPKDFITEKYQTLSYYGYNIEELQRYVIDNGLRGIDRIVPMGHTMDFNLVWDGYDLIRVLSRRLMVF